MPSTYPALIEDKLDILINKYQELQSDYLKLQQENQQLVQHNLQAIAKIDLILEFLDKPSPSINADARHTKSMAISNKSTTDAQHHHEVEAS